MMNSASVVKVSEPVDLQVDKIHSTQRPLRKNSDEVTIEESSESDIEDAEPVEQAHRISQRRRKQNEIFKDWLANRTEEVTSEDSARATSDSNEEMMSVRGLMAKHESNVIINDPREYQLELFEKAKNENVIAVLDTGSGKTLIAVLLLKHVMDKELSDRALGQPPRISFFLVHSVALVFQQFAVLECNLDQPVQRFCGDMNVDSFSRTTWKAHFEANMAIVCTADILLHCLLKSFISTSEINLLVFDEAHKTKKNHAYARIIKDFVITESKSARPKIFGMTASPVDAKQDVEEAARDLEILLGCRIATASDLGLLRQSVSKPKEQICSYKSLPKPYMTGLCQKLHSKFKDVKTFESIFRNAKEAASELGEWAADRSWQFALADEEAEKLQRKTEREFSLIKSRDMTALNAELKLIKEAQIIVSSHSCMSPRNVDQGTSSKVEDLVKILNRAFERPNDSRCIVFVTKRLTARLLADLIPRIANDNLRVGYLVGCRNADAADIKLSVREQILTISKFRKGDLNVLFATSIAEEGLDIPDCNIVIRFDLFTTLIQYIQSRGRARHKNSVFISMIESSNMNHMCMINEVRHNEDIMRRFCSALPEDRLLQGNEKDIDDAFAKEKRLPVYKEPKTGAKLTFHSVLAVIEHFVTCLKRDDESTPKATYAMSFNGRMFVCELILPPNSPITSVVGKPYSRKSLAKRSAAFEAALLLRADGHLDEYLIPIYHKELPKMRNAHLALNSKKKEQYPMMIKPSIWEEGWGQLPSAVYMVMIDLEDPRAFGRHSSPIGILTRVPLIDFPSFPLYPKPKVSTQVVFKRFEESIDMSVTDIEKLSIFTFRFFRDLFNKHYQYEPDRLSYWIAPVKEQARAFQTMKHPKNYIDWEVLDFVQDNEEIKWTAGMRTVELEHRFVLDPMDGSRHFFTKEVVQGMKPSDPVPEGVPKHKSNDDILDWSVSLFKKARLERKSTWNQSQPVIEAEITRHMHNWLDDWTEIEVRKQSSVRCYICPEPLTISSIPAAVATSGYMFPSVIHRLESYLIAQEVCQSLGLQIKPDLALEALTKDSDNTEEHREAQIQFQRGMGKNYERLEFIGDSFLKMATSIALYAKNALDDEFQSHVKRMLMICNKNLFNTAMDINLQWYIRDQSFNRRTWYPEGLKLLKGTAANKTPHEYQHRLADKTIADVCEALIGASLLSSKLGDMDMAVKAVTKLVNNSIFLEKFGENNHDAVKFADYVASYEAPAWQSQEASATHINLVEQCAKEDPGYRFKWPRLLKAAFTHPSTPFVWEGIPSYQRLEFLGDALFDMVCIRHIFDAFPNRDPQWLTEHKMAMVSNKYLGALCVRLGFHKHMRHLNGILAAQITEYVNDVKEAESQSGGRADYWVHARNPPKCLPDIVEAYIGAIFIDSGFDYTEVERFFQDHVLWYFKDMTIYDSFANAHPTTYLSNTLSMSLGCSNFRLMCEELPTIDGSRANETPRIVAVVMIHDQIIADADGTSGRYAKVRASERAVEELKGLSRWDFIRRFKCDCQEVDSQQLLGDPGDFVDTLI